MHLQIISHYTQIIHIIYTYYTHTQNIHIIYTNYTHNIHNTQNLCIKAKIMPQWDFSNFDNGAFIFAKKQQNKNFL